MNNLNRIIIATAVLLYCIPIGAQDTKLNPPARRPFKHKSKIIQQYIDPPGMWLLKSRPVTVLGGRKDGIQMSIEVLSPEKRIIAPSHIDMAFISTSRGAKYSLITEVTFYVDEDEVTFPRAGRKDFLFKGGIMEFVITELPYEAFLRIAGARRVRVRLEGMEIGLKEEHLEIIRDVASRTERADKRIAESCVRGLTT